MLDVTKFEMHTPEPWKFTKRGYETYSSLKGENGAVVIWLQDVYPGYPECGQDLIMEIADPNKALIEAAPELLIENISLRDALDEANAHLAWAREDGKRLQAELAQYKEATITQNYAIEQMLGMALYGKDSSGTPLWGDHTAESLAMEAVKAIASYNGEDMGEPNSYDSDGNPVEMKISGGAVLPSDAALLAETKLLARRIGMARRHRDRFMRVARELRLNLSACEQLRDDAITEADTRLARAEKAEAELAKALFHERFANECLDTCIYERDAALREVKVLRQAIKDEPEYPDNMPTR